MLKTRNLLAHDYDGDIVKEFCDRIVEVYIDEMYLLKEYIEKLSLE